MRLYFFCFYAFFSRSQDARDFVAFAVAVKCANVPMLFEL